MTCRTDPSPPVMKSMMRILEDLAPLNRVVCSKDADRTAEYLCEILPFRVLAIDAAMESNGWVIPPSWDVTEARISKDDRLIYDGLWHPMAVIALSREFAGSVDLAELKKHLHYDHRHPDSIPFHYRGLFRSWHRDWGFCVPKTLRDSLEPGTYDVVIRTEEAPGRMKVLEYVHAGALEQTIALAGNVDHPGVANDGLAGCVVGMEVLRRLRGRRTRFSYSLVLSPGIIGSEYYLAGLGAEGRRRILECMFLEMLGARSGLALQESRDRSASTYWALRASLAGLGLPHHAAAFEEIIINDEYIWENHGIPTVSLSRFPYPEYHSSTDTVEAVSNKSLNEAVEAVMGAIDLLEASPLVIRKFEGNVCLSNPKYDLYVDYGQVALGDPMSRHARRMRYLMDLIPGLQRPTSAKALAARADLTEEDTVEYLRKWEARGLLDLV